MLKFKKEAMTIFLMVMMLPGLSQAKIETDIDVEVGQGFDSNIYRSPSDSYMDNSLTTPLMISPVVESGFYNPVTLKGEGDYVVTSESRIYLGYNFDAVRYLNDKYDNANQYENTISVGGRYYLNPGSRFEYLDVGLEMSNQKRLYLDRDSGTNKASSAGVDVSDRYSYSSKGVILKFKQEKGRLDYSFGGKLIDRDYVDAIYISQMDHRFTELSAGLAYKLNSKYSIYSDYSRQNYQYDERPSRDVQGTLSAANPALEYQIQSLDLGIKHRMNKKIKIATEYTYSTRDDLYVGYHDYVKHRVKVKFRYAYNKKIDFRGSAMIWNRDYPNAYAFDEPGQKQKTYDGTQLALSGSTELGQFTNLSLEMKYVDENSTDLRYDYERYQIVSTIQAKW